MVEEGEIDQTELGWHYQGAVRHAALRDENHEIVAHLFYVTDADGQDWLWVLPVQTMAGGWILIH